MIIAAPTIAVLHQNPSGCFRLTKSSQRRYLGLMYFSSFFYRNDPPHFNGHRENKILFAGGNNFCRAYNFKVIDMGEKAHFLKEGKWRKEPDRSSQVGEADRM